MKKSLSLLLAFALVFSMFSSLALANEDLTTLQKFELLKEEGIFAGINGEAALDQEMTRAQAARIGALLLGKDPDSLTVTEKPYDDVAVDAWYVEEITVVKEEGLFEGYGDGTFGPNDSFTIEQLAVVTAKVLGLEPVEGAEVDGAANWAAGYVQALLDNNVAFPTNYKDNATRGNLVDASFVAAVRLGLVDSGKATSFGVTATGAKKLTVTFDGAVDTSKVKISVFNGSNPVNYKSIEFAEDNKSAVVEFSHNLAEAEYTVKVEGVASETLEAKVKVEAEKVVKIEFSSDKAPIVRGSDDEKISVGYKVFNQYNEEINSTTLIASASKGVPTASNGTLEIDADPQNNGVKYTLGEKVTASLLHSGTGTFANVTLEVSPVAQVASVDIVGVRHVNGEDKELVADTNEDFELVIEAKDQYGNAITSGAIVSSDVVVTVSNQRVAKVNSYDSTSNTATFTGPKNIDGNNKVVLQLERHPENTDNGVVTEFRAGTSTVTILSKLTGARDSFDVVVKEQTKVDVLTLSAPSVAAAGDEIEIPYTAVDQFGNAIQHPTNEMVNSRTASAGTNPSFVKDIANNVTNLKMTLPSSEGPVFITIYTGTNKLTTLTINVTKAKEPTVITGVKDIDTALLKDTGSVEIKPDNVIVKDQYSRDITPAWGTANGNYRVKVESSDDGRVSVTGSVYKNGGTDVSATLDAGGNKGSSTITLTLEKNDSGTWKTVENSSYTFNAKVVDKSDIVSYSAAVDGIVYTGAAGNTDYHKSLVVKGTLEDGSTVTIPNHPSNFDVRSSEDAFDFSGGKVSADGFNVDDDKETADISFVVIVFGAKQEVIPVTFKVSEKTPAPTTLSLKDEYKFVAYDHDNNPATPDIQVGGRKIGDNLVAAKLVAVDDITKVRNLVRGIIKVQDQYGVEMTHDSTVTADANIIISNVTNGKAFNALALEDTFEVAIMTDNGKYFNFKVIVE